MGALNYLCHCVVGSTSHFLNRKSFLPEWMIDIKIIVKTWISSSHLSYKLIKQCFISRKKIKHNVTTSGGLSESTKRKHQVKVLGSSDHQKGRQGRQSESISCRQFRAVLTLFMASFRGSEPRQNCIYLSLAVFVLFLHLLPVGSLPSEFPYSVSILHISVFCCVHTHQSFLGTLCLSLNVHLQ